MSQLFRLLKFTTYPCALYLGWAVLLSDTYFHQVWSLALLLLSYLTLKLFSPPISASKTPLAILTLAILAICLALSPAQLLDTTSIRPNKRSLETLNPGKEDYNIEFVLPSH